MAFFLGEVLSTLAAASILITLMSGAGAFFARALSFPGLASATPPQRLGISLLSGIACLPILLDLVGRLGPLAMMGLALAAGLCGLPSLLKDIATLDRKRARTSLIAMLCWFVFAACMLADMPGPHGLMHSYLVVDYVKHTSATWSIASIGTPPWNPAAYMPGSHAAYYYFFYCLTAVTSLIGASLGIEARHAAFGGSLVMGIGLFALVSLVWQRAGLDHKADNPKTNVFARRPVGILLLVLLFATGLDLIPTLLLAAIRGGFIPGDLEHWNTQVTSWLSSVLWVPHHVAALCSAMTGLIVLGSKIDAKQPSWHSVIFAALAFASMAGMSVYVGLGGAATAAVWAVTLLARKKTALALRIVIAGLLALCLALPWITTLLRIIGGGGPAPITFAIRPFKITDVLIDDEALRSVINLLVLPLSYALEFGIFALGSVVFWQRWGRKGLSNEVAVILLIATLIAFLLGSLLTSTILNNDLGARVMLFAQLGALIWTISLFRQSFSTHGELGRALILCLALGYGFDLLTLFQLRFSPGNNAVQSTFITDEIAAWQWLDKSLPKGSVVQQRPGVMRAIGFALYGHFPMAQADRENARLYGAPMPLIDERIGKLLPVFQDKSLPLDSVMERSAAYDIKALIITSDDAVFSDKDAWTCQLMPAFANDHVKIFMTRQARP